jgi:hypothetical protein
MSKCQEISDKKMKEKRVGRNKSVLIKTAVSASSSLHL